MPQGQFLHSKNPTLGPGDRGEETSSTTTTWVLIDCPPNMGIITLNGLRIADGLCHPHDPGHPLYVRHRPDRRAGAAVGRRAQRRTSSLYGIIINEGYRSRGGGVRCYTSTRFGGLRNNAKNGSSGNHPPVFKTKIPEGNAIASSAEFGAAWHAPPPEVRLPGRLRSVR